MKKKQKSIKFNYRAYFEDNIKFQMKKYKTPRWWAVFRSALYVLRFWFRWNLDGRYWKPLILEGKPQWIKHETSAQEKWTYSDEWCNRESTDTDNAIRTIKETKTDHCKK